VERRAPPMRLATSGLLPMRIVAIHQRQDATLKGAVSLVASMGGLTGSEMGKISEFMSK
jgi:hypothetical protein